jgi:hypothetical protein
VTQPRDGDRDAAEHVHLAAPGDAGGSHPASYPGASGSEGPVYLAPPPNRFAQFIVRLYERAPRWAAPVAVAACFAGAASYVWIADPTHPGASDIPTCIIKLTTGLDCPGCGGTRAFYYLLHGNVPEAARHHVMAVFAAPFLVWLYVAWSVKHIWGKKLPVPNITAKTLSIYLAVWAVFMVARNLPFAPFTSLYV